MDGLFFYKKAVLKLNFELAPCWLERKSAGLYNTVILKNSFPILLKNDSLILLLISRCEE